jgi:predicted secreted protein
MLKGKKYMDNQVCITESDNGKTFRLKLREVLQILLREPRLSGYRWRVIEPGSDVGELEEQTGEAPNVDKQGAEQFREWFFRPRSTGKTNLRFKLSRSWEPEEAATFFDVAVEIASN